MSFFGVKGAGSPKRMTFLTCPRFSKNLLLRSPKGDRNENFQPFSTICRSVLLIFEADSSSRENVAFWRVNRVQ